MKIKTQTALFASLSLIAMNGCGSDTDPGTSAAESASELASSSVSGAVASSSANGAIAYEAPLSTRARFLAELERILAPKSAWAVNTCPLLSSALATCSSGSMTLTLNDCNFLKSDAANFYPASWNGSVTISFRDLNGSLPYCPSGSTFPLASSGTGNAYGASGISITRTMTNLVKSSEDGKMKVTVDTVTPSGWDTAVGLKSGGTTVVHTSASAQSITINGIHYLANKSYQTKKGDPRTKTVWDHTISTSGALSNTFSAGTHTTTGNLILQHNLAKYTATAQIQSLTHRPSTCGCLPTGGTITTTFSGSRSDVEILTITGCGQATLKSGATLSAATAATATALTLSHCQ